MGLFDQVLGGLIGQLGSGQQKNALMNLATSVIQGHPGGLAGIIQEFTNAGLGQQAASWVGTGENQPVSPEDTLKALGADNVRALAQKLGVPPEAASSGLAALLPVIIDQLTPKGQVEHGVDMASALNALRGKLMAS
jgi:uncharacterized protein YidB (DUF937 family)